VAQGFKQLGFGNILLLNQDFADGAAFFLPDAPGLGHNIFIQMVIVDKYLG
jgi:hypothetical protein